MLNSLLIKNFRNISDISLKCFAGVNFLFGKNGQGKTNILEAIHIFSIGRPFRAKVFYDAIKFEKDSFHLFAGFKTWKAEVHAAVVPLEKKKFLIDETKVSFFDFLGNFCTVLFSPQNIEIVTGSPNTRRDYLDSILVHIDKSYYLVLKNYKNALKQRNCLLKKIEQKKAQTNELVPWNLLLNKNAQIIWQKRKELIQAVETILKQQYKTLSQKNDLIKIIYYPKSKSNNFLDDLKQSYAKDLAMGVTSLGPHRDDFEILLNQQNASKFASQGEIRSLVLGLKFSEIEILENFYQKPVVLLLDDVFSELDKNRQKSLLAMVQNRQTFISTTHLEKSFLKKAKAFEIKKGAIANIFSF